MICCCCWHFEKLLSIICSLFILCICFFGSPDSNIHEICHLGAEDVLLWRMQVFAVTVLVMPTFYFPIELRISGFISAVGHWYRSFSVIEKKLVTVIFGFTSEIFLSTTFSFESPLELLLNTTSTVAEEVQEWSLWLPGC